MYCVGAFHLKIQEKLFLEEHFSNLADIKIRKEFTKFMEDMVRENYKEINNICHINFTSHGYTKDRTSLRLYGKCIYGTEMCRKYKFIVFLKEFPIAAKVFANNDIIMYTQHSKKIQQVRADKLPKRK